MMSSTAPNRRGDDGKAGGHAFDDRDRQVFGKGGQHQDIGLGNESRDLVGADPAGDGDAIGKAHLDRFGTRRFDGAVARNGGAPALEVLHALQGFA